jgi:alpha-tubulin suppressor-like RCC1 family protein
MGTTTRNPKPGKTVTETNCMKKAPHFYRVAGLLLSLVGVWLTYHAVLAGTAFNPAGVKSTTASSKVISIWGGARETIALKADGTVWTWCLNSCGGLGSGPCCKLGDGTETSRSLPVQVHGPGDVGYLMGVTAIMGGEHSNYALKSDGTLWAWGGNFVGQLGDGTYTNTVTPVQVIGVTNPLTVTGGGFFSLALMPDHTLLAWGRNNHGELGDGSYTQRPAPVQVSSVLSNVVNVSAGWFHAVALTADHKVWTWGDNTNGEIGIGITSTTGVTVPVQVPGLSNVTRVSAGDGFTAILKSDGTVWTWGGNDFGQLGDGTFSDRSTPVQVLGLSNVVYIAARDYHVLAIKSDGTIWAWGSGGNGELGNDELVDKNTPRT